MSNETKDALLYEQLQEGLSYNLMKSPAVSGAKGYQELCQAAKSDERRQQGLSRRQMYQRDDPKGNSNSNQKKSVIGAQPVVIKQQARLQSTPEMGVSSMRCYNCSQVGHVAKYCPEKKAARVMAPGDSEDAASHTPCDPWIRTVATVTKQHSLEVSQRQGPVYKVDVEIEGLKTRALLLDHGAQVSLIRKQMLPQIQEDRGWTKEQCHSKNLVLDQQPVGAEGNSLGAVGVVQLQVKVENMGVHRQVPFYVLDSSKPIWNGELANCGVILGTNALDNLGFRISLPDGSTVTPESTTGAVDVAAGTSPYAQPSETDQVSTEEKQEAPVGQVKIPLTNWAMEPLVINNGQIVGTVEEVSLVSNGDVVWKKQPDLVTRISSSAEQLQGRKRHIEQHLNVGNECSHNERNSLLQLLLEKHQVFALSDEELGETDLVEHQIEMSEHKPFKVFPRRLPYALREELEVELDQLLHVGCIEPSSSPYASGLVLVRKKDGGLRVCVDYRGINKNTVPDRYPLPRVDELIDTVGKQKGKFFTSLDLMKGYHQIRVADCDKTKTAFIATEDCCNTVECHLGSPTPQLHSRD